jgi:nucleoside-diphosphate-sugar epimerase
VPTASVPVDPFVGDVLDPDAVLAAVRGEDAVICALGTMPETPGDAARRQPGVAVCSIGTRHIIAAMEASGVPRLVVVSSTSVGESYRDGRLGAGWIVRRVLGQVMADKEIQERMVRESRLAWTIVRPVKMNDGPQRGNVRRAERLRWTLATRVSRADAAAEMIAILGDQSTIGRALTIAS